LAQISLLCQKRKETEPKRFRDRWMGPVESGTKHLNTSEEKGVLMNPKEFYTTGETARLLNIAESTISRMFDRGILYGQQNPITGKRLVSRESIAAIMKRTHHPSSGFPSEKKKILLGSGDEGLLSFVRTAFQGDDRVQIQQAKFGGDVLIQCSKEPPDLLVIDEEFSGITCAQIIQSLRRVEDHKNLKVLCWARAENADQCLTWGADGILKKGEMDEEDWKVRVYSLLGMAEEHPKRAEKFEHQRRWPRTAVDLPAKIWIYRLRKAHVREGGEAKVDDISMTGAHLSEIRLEKETLPADAFRIVLEVDQEPLKQWRVHCKVIRLESNGGLEAGVQFVRLSRAKQQILETILQKQM